MEFSPHVKEQSGTISYSKAALEDDLIPSLWQQLPLELLQRVLTRLPLSSLRKFSRVSKQWKTLFRSVEFARACDSEEPTLYYLDLHDPNNPCMLLPNLETKSWDKHYLDFVSADERVDDRVAADHGLLCYRIYKKEGLQSSVILVIQNPLTRKFRRLILPYTYELQRIQEDETLWGLMMEHQTGIYKVVVGFFSQHLTRKTFIYDSSSNSWSVSAAGSPVLVRHFLNDFEPECCVVRSCVCCGGELLWLVVEEFENEPSDNDPAFTWLVKYSMKLDEWSTAKHQPPIHYRKGEVHLVHHAVENRPFMVNFLNIHPPLREGDLPRRASRVDALNIHPVMREVDLPRNCRFPSLEDIARLVEQAGYNGFPAEFERSLVGFSGGTWWFFVQTTSPSRPHVPCVDVFALSINPPRVIRFRKLYDRQINSLVTFIATLKAFV